MICPVCKNGMNTVQILCGDALEQLKTLPDGSVHCCVTSPPYYGLRDYGVTGQIGLEETPEAYVAKLVDVFREVRRVLRDDGTLWVNLGSTYASSRDTRASQSRPHSHVQTYGNDGTISRHFQACGRACCDCGDEPQGVIPNHHDGTFHNAQSAEQVTSQTLRTTHGSEQMGCETEPPNSLPSVVLESTKTESSCLPRGDSGLLIEALASPKEARTLQHSLQECVCKVVYRNGTTQKSQPSDCCKKDMGFSFSACGKPGCNGVGRCGLCWVSLSISSLNIKSKDMINIPMLVAFALQADGWILRQDIIWHKPNPMPESVRDRCTKAHEYMFLLAKQPRYWFDSGAMKEESKTAGKILGFTTVQADAINRKPSGNQKPENYRKLRGEHRNRRSVWSICPRPYKGAHFAVFPPALVEPCIKAGCPAGGTVLDPFGGSGTTGQVAKSLGRNAILIELNPNYIPLIEQRIA